MENFTKLNEISHERFPDEKIFKWDFVEIEKDSEVRIYYKTNETVNANGFYFYVIYRVSYECNKFTDKNNWDENFVSVNCLFHGVAYFDGVTHLHMGDKQTLNEGYLYYPNLKDIVNVFQKIQELENRFCSEYR